ncbi:hypothetical protein [Ktedonobacter racemifer]|nr:hypothetical protein [Ktedonobacter racemifer]
MPIAIQLGGLISRTPPGVHCVLPETDDLLPLFTSQAICKHFFR